MAPWSNLHRPASRNRRITGAVAAVVIVTLALGVGLASQRRLSAAPLPTAPLPTGPLPTAPLPTAPLRSPPRRDMRAWAASRMGSTETSTWPTRTA